MGDENKRLPEENLDDILEWEEEMPEDAETCIVCYGGTARSVAPRVISRVPSRALPTPLTVSIAREQVSSMAAR